VFFSRDISAAENKPSYKNQNRSLFTKSIHKTSCGAFNMVLKNQPFKL